MPRSTQLLLKGDAAFIGIAAHSSSAQHVGDEQQQHQTEQQQSAESLEGSLETVMVTARRRAERIEDVPIAVTLIDGGDLHKQSLVTVADLPLKTPGLAIQDSAFGGTMPTIGIRGQLQKSSYATTDQSVGVYLNEVVLARPHGVNAALYDLESVQVLKGPQGTLFGRNTPGGAILLSTKAPGQELEGYVRATMGNFGAYGFEGALNLPLSDTFQARAAGRLSRRDGYTRNLYTGNDLNDEDSRNWRLSLRYTPTDALRTDLVVTGSDETPRGTPFKLAHVYPSGRGPEAQPFLELLASQPFQTVNSEDTRTSTETFTVTHKLEWDVSPGITVRNIFGYRSIDSEVYGDFDGTPLNINETREFEDVRQYSEELQILGESARLDWIAGLYFFEEKGRNVHDVLSGSTRRVTDGLIHNKSYAGYVQATYELPFAPEVSVTGGVRYTKDERRIVARNFTNGVCRLTTTNTSTEVLDPCSRPASVDFSEPTYTVSIDWQPDADTLLYATNRRGYRSGGFTFTGVSRPADFAPFAPETVTDYEVGLKKSVRVGGVRMRLNVAGFYSDYKDVQRIIARTIVDGGATFSSSVIANAASAEAKGIELDLLVRLTSWLELSAFYNYIDTKYTKWLTPTGVDLSKNAFAGIPEHSGGGSIEFNVPLGPAVGDVSFRTDVHYQSETYFQEFNTDPITGERYSAQRIAPRTLVNLRADWKEIMGSTLSAGVFVRNVTDRKYFHSGVDLTAAVGVGTKFPGAPRTWGVDLEYRF